MNPNIDELPEELKFKVGDVIRKINAGAYDTKMIVVRIEKDYYLCDNIGRYSSSMVSIAEQDNYELVKESESKVTRNNGLLNEFQAEHDSDDWTLTNAILWGMQKQKRIDIDKACEWITENYDVYGTDKSIIDGLTKALEDAYRVKP